LISVIIPAFNEEENLKCLLPLLDELSMEHNVEIIVSIGECTGNYKDCIKALKNGRLVADKRKGRAKQMNDGAAMAKGDTLVFLHADVTPPKGFFEDIKETLSNGYDAGFFSYKFDKNTFFLKLNASFTRKDGVFTGGGDQCLFIKREIFLKMRGFNESQVLMEDFEFFKRMKKNKVRYTIVDNALTVSARKYKDNSYVKVNLTNLLLVFLFKIGFAPQRLKTVHDRLLRLPYQNK